VLVRCVYLVELHDAERAHARGGQVHQPRRTQSTGAHEEHLGVLQPLLPVHPHVGNDQVAGVPADLVDGELVGRLDQGWQRHGDSVRSRELCVLFYPTLPRLVPFRDGRLGLRNHIRHAASIQMSASDSSSPIRDRHPSRSRAVRTSACCQAPQPSGYGTTWDGGPGRPCGGPSSSCSAPVYPEIRASDSAASRSRTAWPVPMLITPCAAESVAACTARATSLTSTKSRCTPRPPSFSSASPCCMARRSASASRPSGEPAGVAGPV